MKKYAGILLIVGFFIMLAPQAVAHAQEVYVPPSVTVPIACISLPADIYYGSTDSSSDSEVTTLQKYLQEKGYFPYSPVGIFGPLTFAAVKNFQEANGIDATGYVGPITRKAIENLTCQPIPPSSSVSIQSLTPVSGSVGTQVSIMGYGFAATNTILFAGGAILNIPVASTTIWNASTCTSNLNCEAPPQTLTFTIPSSIGPNCTGDVMCPDYERLITSGTYTVSVQNTNGTSNTDTFMVTSESGSPVLPE